jgi:hypothetical protein
MDERVLAHEPICAGFFGVSSQLSIINETHRRGRGEGPELNENHASEAQAFDPIAASAEEPSRG